LSSASHTQCTALFGQQPFLEFSWQMATIAVGWQLYALTSSAFDLGMVGGFVRLSPD
jgi:hypothetical protein